MLKKFKDFFSNRNVIYVPDEDKESQEELNDNLNKSIRTCDYFLFDDSINKGADINNVTFGGKDSDNDDYYVSPLVLCVIYDRLKMLKKLIDLNVNLINVITDDDIYDYIKDLMKTSDSEKAIKYIIKKNPDFMKDIEAIKNTKKFNI